MAMAGTLVEAMADPFVPDNDRDEYRDQVMAMVKKSA